LARIATSISVAEVVAAIDGDIGLTQCSVHVDECARTTYCPTRPHWAAINRAVGEALSAISLDAMLTPAAFVPRISSSPNPSQPDEPRYSA
jgi:DNA-binding IscR family transcriptional regulator